MDRNALRILCLHGYCQNGDKLRTQISAFRKKVKGSVFEFPDAPFIVPPTDHFLKNIVKESTVSDEDASISNKYRSWFFRDRPDTPNMVNKSFETLAYVMRNEGPFDGVFGFSQGASMAALLISSIENNDPIFEAVHKPKFVILCAGVKRSIKEDARPSVDEGLRTPSLHIIGENDTIVDNEKSKNLAACFKNCKILYHPGGHFMPQKAEFLAKVFEFIHKIMIDMEIKHEPLVNSPHFKM